MADAQGCEEFNLGSVFLALAEALPARDYLITKDRSYSYAEIAARARRLASLLESRGLGAARERAELWGHESGQDHVGLALYNGPEYLEGMIGSYLSRCAPFNVNYRYVGQELRYLFEDACPRALIYHASLAPVISEALAAMDAPPNLLLQVADDSGEPLLPGAISYEEALTTADPGGPRATPSPEDLYLLYTGGTTGMPKGVLWRQHDIFMAAMGGRKLGPPWGTLDSYDELKASALEGRGLKVLLVAPLMHGAAQWAAFVTACRGATLVTLHGTRSLDPTDVWRRVEQEGVSTFLVVGDAMVRPLLDELDRQHYDTASLVAIANGGAPLTGALRSMIAERLPGVIISDAAGSSEAGAQMTSAAGQTAAGSFQPGPDTTVVSEDFDTILEPGHEGIGWLAQGGLIPLGYLNDPESSAKAFRMIGGRRYAVPGDRARLLESGAIELLGRDSMTISSGGEKIFAEEVEAAISGHPKVADVVVAGRLSQRWGHEVVAVVQLAPGAERDPKSIIEHASQQIARYKLPKDIIFVDRIQRSPAGKADYRWAKAIVKRGGEG